MQQQQQKKNNNANQRANQRAHRHTHTRKIAKCNKNKIQQFFLSRKPYVRCVCVCLSSASKLILLLGFGLDFTIRYFQYANKTQRRINAKKYRFFFAGNYAMKNE